MESIYIVKSINRGGRNYVLRLFPKDSRIDYRPGQFINLVYSGIERSYSIASIPDYPYIELFITKTGGAFTSKLDELQGKEITVKGPFGRFLYENQKQALFVATGSGISPIMSILRYIYSRGIDGNFHLMASFRYREENLYESEMRLMSRLGLDLDIRYTGEGDPRISIEDISKYRDIDMYLCGNREFMIDIVKTLRPRKFYIETW
ncbi:MAG: FAD-binding oxidoreductase [Candidatus Micrarchaeota archaeon]|nr:FAD-binding oxidoreductase [Candidatus Micrarchaeota archaeon]MCX8154364.1 FAD-binding oxidoreductase [Candidatus Micrarchaeota archaeon]